jgi:hypothetical protein
MYQKYHDFICIIVDLLENNLVRNCHDPAESSRHYIGRDSHGTGRLLIITQSTDDYRGLFAWDSEIKHTSLLLKLKGHKRCTSQTYIPCIKHL